MLHKRYRRIVTFFASILISHVLWDLILPRLGLGYLSRRTRSRRLQRSASRFRSLAVQMGGVMIKVGQFFSARVDVLPNVITAELAGLQDEVPAESFEDVRRIVEEEFAAPLLAKFAWFDPEPLAAASLGQVHRARLLLEESTQDLSGSPEGEEGSHSVVVKVQRPEIDLIIDTDLRALRTIGNWLNRYAPVRKRADVPALLSEFTRILHAEIDYIGEGQNAETFARNFNNTPDIRVPRVWWSHTTRRVLTLEDVFAIKISDFETITASGVDRKQVAKRLMNTYLKQIFEDGFFHADPHPGNLFISPGREKVAAGARKEEARGIEEDIGEDMHPGGEWAAAPDRIPEDDSSWQLTFVDFGMVGRVPGNLRHGMREMLIAVGTRDAARMVRSFQMMGVLLPGADLSLIERAETEVFNRFWGKSMNELRQASFQEIKQLTGQFRELIYDLPFQVPEDLILLGRTLGILSGMCTGLDPQFNVWEQLVPYAQRMVREEMVDGREIWVEELKALARRLIAIPGRAESVLTKIEQGEINVHDPLLSSQLNRMERTFARLVGSIVFAAFLVGGIQLYLANVILLSWLLLVGAGISLIWVIFSDRRRS